MKFTLILTFIGCLSLSIGSNAQADCDKIPTFSGKECCKVPTIKEMDKFEKIVMGLKNKEFTGSSAAIECKAGEHILAEFKLLKDKDLDKDAIIKFIEANLEENEWKIVVKTSFEGCLKEITEKLPEIQKKLEAAPFNLKKDECNVKFIAVAFCTSMETLKNCPEGAHAKDKDCVDFKDWVKKCRNSYNMYSELSSKLNAKNTST